MTAARLYFTLVTWLIALSSIYAQKDLIIFRTGKEQNVQVDLVTNEKTIIRDGNGLQQELSNRNLYMIKYDKRGNVFFTETGERITDNENDGKMPKGSAAIYLIEGKEIIAFDISIDVDKITYFPLNKKNSIISFSKKSDTSATIPKENVFMIKYQDGTKDLITDFEALKRKKEEEIARKNKQDEDAKRLAWIQSFPKSATIITKKEAVINATVLSDDGVVVTYKRVSMVNSPVFKMDRTNIQDVFYKDSK